MTKIYDLPGHMIRRLHQISVSAFGAEAASVDADLTPVQYAALVVLRENAGIDQATLAGLIAYDRVTIGGVVSRLEARGYIKREISGSDRRSKVLMLTEMGEMLLDALPEAVANAQVAMLQGLTDGERAIFLELLRKTIDAGNGTSRAPYRPIR